MKIALIIFGYIIVAATSSFVAIWFIPKHLRHRKRYIFAQLISSAIFMPILGLIGVLIFTILFRKMRHFKSLHYVKTVGYPDYLKEHIVTPKTFGEGGAYSYLQEISLPVNARVLTLSAINSFSARLANRINRLMLTDLDYEVRLYAFSALNNQENAVNNDIIEIMQQFEHSNNNIYRAKCCRQLAMLYWELIYRNLTTKEMTVDILKKVEFYLAIARKQLKHDAELLLLEAKIALYKQDDNRASWAFQQALAQKVPASKVRPYLAEMYYKKRDFDKVRHNLSFDPNLADIPALEPIISFWSG